MSSAAPPGHGDGGDGRGSRGGEGRSDGPLAPQHRVITIVLLAQITIIAFEELAVSTIMPTVATELGAVRIYGLAFSLMLSAQLLGTVVAGAWCDRRGPVPAMVVGAALFGFGLLVTGLASTFAVLAGGRMVSGLGGGLFVVSLYVAIGRAYPPALRATVLAWVSAAWVLPSLVGPVLAAWLTQVWSWRVVFLGVVPALLVMTGLTWARRGEIDPRRRWRTGVAEGETLSRRDVWAGLAVAVGTGALQWGSTQLSPPTGWSLLACAVGIGVVAALVPRLLPDGSVRSAPGLPSVMSSRFLMAFAWAGSISFIPLMLVAERGLTTTTAGALLAIGSIGWSVGAALQSRPEFARRRRVLIPAGAGSIAVGLVLLSGTAWFGWPAAVALLGVIGLGLGMGFGMSTSAVLSLDLSPVVEHGRVSASLQLADALGAALGIATTGAVFAWMHVRPGSDGHVYPVLFGACALAALTLVVTGRRATARGLHLDDGPT